MRAAIPPLICTLALATTTFAQKPADDHTSTVSGRVFCADTNAPARTASVILQPVEVVKALEAGPGHHYSFSGERVQTLLDGAFTIHHVKAGAYYVVASLPGYLSPFPAFEDPDPDPANSKPETAKKPAIAAPLITVQSGLPVTVNVTLERGASVSGTVLFDDGSPAVGLNVSLLAQAKNSWGPLREQPFSGDLFPFATTNDQGNYRIAGLAKGKYVAQVILSRSTESFHFDEHGSGISSTNSGDSLTFYSEGKTRRSDAAPFSLSVGEDRHGEDIQIPLSKLHTVRGSIIAARDGHVVNAGSVHLQYADDKSPLTSASVSRDDQEFTFSYVPEGDFILRVDAAADVEYIEKPNPPNSMPPSNTEERILRTYGSAEQPLHITSDLTGIVISVPDQQQPAAPPKP